MIQGHVGSLEFDKQGFLYCFSAVSNFFLYSETMKTKICLQHPHLFSHIKTLILFYKLF